MDLYPSRRSLSAGSSIPKKCHVVSSLWSKEASEEIAMACEKPFLRFVVSLCRGGGTAAREERTDQSNHQVRLMIHQCMKDTFNI